MVEYLSVDEKFLAEMDLKRIPNKDVGLFQACSENVVVFAELMLGIRLYAWQVKFLSDIQDAIDNNNQLQQEFVANTSRQIGKSTAVAVLSIWATVFNKYPGTIKNATLVGITSASDGQAKKLLKDMRDLLRLGDIFMKTKYVTDDGKPKFGYFDSKGKFVGLFENLLSTDDPNNTQQITFKAYEPSMGVFLKDSKGGSVIKSYPPTSGILGETFSIVIVDEAGKTDKVSDTFYYDYIYPTGNSTKAIRINTSTPWVSAGFFYRMVDPEDMYSKTDNYRVYSFTIDAIKLENPDYYSVVMKTIRQLTDDGKLDEVQRAYYCRFVKGTQSYFEPEKVVDVFKDELEMFEESQLECDLGVDFGAQKSSRSCLTLSHLNSDNKIIRLYHRVYDVGTDLQMVQDIIDLRKRFNVQRIIPDDCAAGSFMIEEMKQKGLPVHPMNFKADKVKKYSALRSQVRKGNVWSYPDVELKTEMLALEYTEGVRSTLIKHAPGYSDDLIDSFLMSCYFYLQEDDGVKFYDTDDY
jgi:hypothetical protein